MSVQRTFLSWSLWWFIGSQCLLCHNQPSLRGWDEYVHTTRMTYMFRIFQITAWSCREGGDGWKCLKSWLNLKKKTIVTKNLKRDSFPACCLPVKSNPVKMNSSIRSFQFEGTVEVKSKFDAEFRRFRLEKQRYQTFDTFKLLLCDLHHLKTVPFVVKYADEDNDLLPITNDDNYMAALRKAKPLLRLVIQREGEGYDDTRLGKSSTLLNTILGGTPKDSKKNNLRISNPKEFRQVSAIIDVDLVPETCRRVKLLKHGSDKPLGFYIRDGTSVRVTPQGLEKVPGIFISRYKK